MGVNVVVVILAILLCLQIGVGQPVWGSSGPGKEEKCVCNPVIHVHNYGDKKAGETETSEWDQLQAHLAQLQELDIVLTNNLTQLQETVGSLRTNAAQQDIVIAESQKQIWNVTAELTLLKQSNANHERLTCPSGYDLFKDRCFSFSADPKTFSDARSACQDAGGHLALVKDQATNDHLLDLIKPRRPSGVWFGLTDQIQDGLWVWEDGTVLTGWSNWTPGVPDNYLISQQCAEWALTYGYKWNDAGCHNRLSYVCEIKAAAP